MPLILLDFSKCQDSGQTGNLPVRWAFAAYRTELLTKLSTDPVGNKKSPV